MLWFKSQGSKSSIDPGSIKFPKLITSFFNPRYLEVAYGDRLTLSFVRDNKRRNRKLNGLLDRTPLVNHGQTSTHQNIPKDLNTVFGLVLRLQFWSGGCPNFAISRIRAANISRRRSLIEIFHLNTSTTNHILDPLPQLISDMSRHQRELGH